EDGTEAAGLDRKVSRAAVARRFARISALAEELCNQRAEERVGSIVEVLVESASGGVAEGRAAHQAPEVDGATTLQGARGVRVGDLVRARVTAAEGVDLIAVPVTTPQPVPAQAARAPGRPPAAVGSGHE